MGRSRAGECDRELDGDFVGVRYAVDEERIAAGEVGSADESVGSDRIAALGGKVAGRRDGGTVTCRWREGNGCR